MAAFKPTSQLYISQILLSHYKILIDLNFRSGLFPSRLINLSAYNPFICLVLFNFGSFVKRDMNLITLIYQVLYS